MARILACSGRSCSRRAALAAASLASRAARPGGPARLSATSSADERPPSGIEISTEPSTSERGRGEQQLGDPPSRQSIARRRVEDRPAAIALEPVRGDPAALAAALPAERLDRVAPELGDAPPGSPQPDQRRRELRRRRRGAGPRCPPPRRSASPGSRARRRSRARCRPWRCRRASSARRRSTSTASLKTFAWRRPFWPVVESTTISVSEGAAAEPLVDHAVDLGELLHQVVAGVQAPGGVDQDDVGCRAPRRRRSRRRRPRRRPGRSRRLTISQPARSRPGRRAARRRRRGRCRRRRASTDRPASRCRCQASLPTVVVLPVPLTPTTSTTAGRGRRSIVVAAARGELGEQLDQPRPDRLAALDLARPRPRPRAGRPPPRWCGRRRRP